MRTMLLVSSTARSLYRFKRELIQALSQRGVKIFAAAPDHDNESRRRLAALGAAAVDIRLTRASLSPVDAIRDAFSIAKIMRRIRPDAVASIFLKPSVLALIASTFCRGAHRFVFVEGLGYYFTPPLSRGWLARARRRVFLWAIRAAVRSSRLSFFVNATDQASICNSKLKSVSLLLPGIGLDLTYFSAAPAIPDQPTFVFIGRLLRTKGLVEFVNASIILSERLIDARFIVIGADDENIDRLSATELDALRRRSRIEWIGFADDIRPFLRMATACVLPSYREGSSRVLQEAMAMSTAIITTDVTGCRELVFDYQNGLLVPPRDCDALAHAMALLVENPNIAMHMGLRGRKLAETHFDGKKIAISLVNMMTNTPIRAELQS